MPQPGKRAILVYANGITQIMGMWDTKFEIKPTVELPASVTLTHTAIRAGFVGVKPRMVIYRELPKPFVVKLTDSTHLDPRQQ
jgi:hypothetical protein